MFGSNISEVQFLMECNDLEMFIRDIHMNWKKYSRDQGNEILDDAEHIGVSVVGLEWDEIPYNEQKEIEELRVTQ
jgi:hypothetical protein